MCVHECDTKRTLPSPWVMSMSNALANACMHSRIFLFSLALYHFDLDRNLAFFSAALLQRNGSSTSAQGEAAEVDQC